MASTVHFLVTAIGAGGAERQLLLMAKGIARRGHKVEIWVLGSIQAGSPYQVLLSESLAAGVSVYDAIGIGGLIVRLITRHEPNSVGRPNLLYWSWGYRVELLRLLFAPLSYAVFSIRSASESQAKRWERLLAIGRHFTWRYISNSHLGVAIADRVAPGIAAKAWVVPNALEASFLNSTNPLGERPAVLEVLMLGNVRYSVKGYDLALIVGRKIRDAGLPIRIRIGGAQYANETDLQAEISQAGLADIVSWAGSIKDSLSFLQRGHAFMLLSRYEGMPNALFEAMAVGLPCVATAVGDLPYYAQESDGLKVVPIEDAEAAFREVCRIWNNWDEAVAMGRRAKRFCQERFSEERMVADVIKALELEPAPSGRRVEI